MSLKSNTLKMEKYQFKSKISDVGTIQVPDESLFGKEVEIIILSQKVPKKRKFGSGKHLIAHVAEDFKDTPDIFKEYLP